MGYGESWQENEDSNWWQAGGDFSAMENMPSPPRIDPLKASIEAAARMKKGVKVDLPENPGWQELFTKHSSHLEWAEALSNPKILSDPEIKNNTFKAIGITYPSSFGAIDLEKIGEAEVKDAREFIRKRLNNLTQKLNKERNGPEAPSIFIEQPEIAVAQRPNWLSRSFRETSNRIDELLAHKSPSQKLLMAGAANVVGGILIHQGGSHFIDGLRGVEVQYKANAEGNIEGEVKEMALGKKATKIVLGALAGLIGMAAEIFGFAVLYKTLMSH